MKLILRVLAKIAVAIVLFYISGAACFWLGIYVFPKLTPDQARIEDMMMLQLPADATDVQTVIHEGFMDDLFFLRFTVPQTSYDTFIAQLCDRPNETLETEMNGILGVGGVRYPDWWYTDSSVIDLSGRCGQDVFIDLQDSGNVTLYIVGL